MTMTCGIYKITEIDTGRCYIGQSKQIEGRWKRHHKRFPTDRFSYEVLLKCDDDVLDFFEKAFIDGYDSHRCGFNKTLGGSAIKSRYPDAETRRKIGEASKNRSEETRLKISDANKRRPPLSEEACRRMSEALKGKPLSEEHRRKLSEAKKAYYAARKLNNA